MTIGLLPGAPPGALPRPPPAPPQNGMDLGIHGVRTPWIRGFMVFRRVRRAGAVMLMVPTSSDGV